MFTRRENPPSNERNPNHPHTMLGPLGIQELLIISLLVVLLFGAKRIPAMARSIGQSLGEFKRGRHESELDDATRLKISD